jgi:hypothetical protein
MAAVGKMLADMHREFRQLESRVWEAFEVFCDKMVLDKVRAGMDPEVCSELMWEAKRNKDSSQNQLKALCREVKSLASASQKLADESVASVDTAPALMKTRMDRYRCRFWRTQMAHGLLVVSPCNARAF